MSEQLIKSKNRVKDHGEVFTPSWLVQKMLNTAGIKEACEDINVTFLEPAAGDGNFLVAILNRKLKMVSEKYAESLSQFENYSLYALSTIYGVELLDDNVKECVMRMIEAYMNFYKEMIIKFEGKPHKNIESSARIIIKNNIQQGNFLTRLTDDGSPIKFIEWKVLDKSFPKTKTIKVSCQPFTLESLYATEKSNYDIFSVLGVEFEEEMIDEKNERDYITSRITTLKNLEVI
ncbi:DNA methyltransferase family protein [Enterococcus durans]|uniref:methylase n=1 Tax=Enterococcus durans TaxID=53345 RepID=UPI00115A590E|nr:methylase [Enterococcus durans]